MKIKITSINIDNQLLESKEFELGGNKFYITINDKTFAINEYGKIIKSKIKNKSTYDKILKYHKKLKKKVISLMNDQITRQFIKDYYVKKLGYEIAIKCDEENNTPSLIDDNLLMVRISWREEDMPMNEHKSVDLYYGNPTHISKYVTSGTIII